jgi:hypothetical protein
MVVTSVDASSGTCPITVTRTYTVKDACGNWSTALQIICVKDSTPPAITGTITNITLEGCSASDATPAVTTVAGLELLGLNISDTCTSDANLVVTSTVVTNGTCPITVTRTYTVKDACGNGSNAVQIIYVNDTTPPTFALTNGVTGPVGPLPLGTPATITVRFTDSCPQGRTVTYNWDDGSSNTVALASGVGTNSLSHTYTNAGVYTVGVTVNDGCGNSVSSILEFTVIYDANGGFVTGGGWINSPPGAYLLNTNMVGKANFGFVSKYQKGATIPTGETEFQFKTGDLNFHSTVYEWLVIAGAKAQYKGSGTINGSGDYGFLLTATDGQVNGGGGIDKFRIKIWNKAPNFIVYDNAPGSDDINASNTQAIGGGSIVIHK